MTAPIPAKALANARVAPIRAELAGTRCSALGLTGTGNTPCPALIEHGIPPDTPLEVYRGPVLALRGRTVGEGAQIEVRDNRYGAPVFRRVAPGEVPASPMRQTDDPFPLQPPTENNAPDVRRRAP